MQTDFAFPMRSIFYMLKEQISLRSRVRAAVFALPERERVL